ncbi:hypothetical protein COCNU_09G009320 [Cocos nucifera]|uniref:Uncharacterized protein n=1 Tax=Cocos nucifera TaxID=13894 RepID=A0A8K0ILC5_COCNU|nr:hypothetical protein COCNU_09G009320 [Cocos nucifera]
MECPTSPIRNTRDADGRESNSPVLRSLIDCMPTLVFGFVLTVVSPCITIESDQVVIKKASAASYHIIHMDVFAFSMVGAFASALSSITFQYPSQPPAIAHVLEYLPVLFLGSAFASLVSVLIQEHFRWFAYVICMIPAIVPLFRRSWQSLSNCLVALVRILKALVARWFDGGEASEVRTGDGCGSV